MEILDKLYVVELSKCQFATSAGPFPGIGVGWEECDKFTYRKEAAALLKECRKAGADGRIAVMKVRIKNSMR